MSTFDIGSETAKSGFRNEQDVIDKFNNWQKDNLAQEWLMKMGYEISQIEYVKAIKITGSYKADVQVQVKITIKLKDEIDCQNLQVKLVSNPRGYNQIDKRWVDKYKELWNIPSDVEQLLKLYTGETAPYIKNPKDKRRMFAFEFSKEEQEKLLSFLKNNKTLIVSDILKGRGKFSAEWLLVILKIDNSYSWALEPINKVLNYFANGDVLITKQGNFKIGKITMQRKGGDKGRKTAQMLQFKINPAEIVVK